MTRLIAKSLNIVLSSLLISTASAQAQSLREAVYTPDGTAFSLFAPSNARRVTLRIYPSDEAKKPSRKIDMAYSASSSRWEATVEGDLKGLFYTFSVDPGRGYLDETTGIFATAVGTNGRRAAIIDMADTDPQGWEQDQRPTLMSPADLVIYEMHHRDYSIDESSGIQHNGKFLALTEPVAINHLKALGVNAVHILPSFDYASVDESRLQEPQYNWGYDPKNYNVPDGSYSTDPSNPQTRIREFKEMVKSLHKAGIRVILDVVYNHTFDIEHSAFQLTYPDYFYRKRADGSYSDGSGCGNETASEQPMMRRYMAESMLWWVNEYHIDGFRVDLMGVHDIETMNLIRAEMDKIDPSIFIYGEGWSAGECAYPAEKLATKANTGKLNRIAAFSDELRDALRGPFSDDRQAAFLGGLGGHEESIKFGICGAIAHPDVDMSLVNYSKEPWAHEPTQMISYVSCHDDMCLVDRLRSSVAGTASPEELVRLDLLAQTAVLTSQGVPFILSGEEMLRDKRGVHNSFNAPDSVNHLDWQNLERYPMVFAYYKNLIALRRHHPAFRLGSAELVRRHLKFLPSKEAFVAFVLKDNAGGDNWKNIYVALNGGKTEQTFDVPEGSYTIVCREGVIDEMGLAPLQGGTVVVPPQSALIFYEH